MKNLLYVVNSIFGCCDKLHLLTLWGIGGIDHGLFLPHVEGKYSARWLRDDKTLQFYDLQTVLTSICFIFRSTHLFNFCFICGGLFIYHCFSGCIGRVPQETQGSQS